MSSASLLIAVEAAIEVLLARRVKSYTIGTVEYTYLDLAELRAWRNDLRAETGAAGARSRVWLADLGGGS